MTRRGMQAPAGSPSVREVCRDRRAIGDLDQCRWSKTFKAFLNRLLAVRRVQQRRSLLSSAKAARSCGPPHPIFPAERCETRTSSVRQRNQCRGIPRVVGINVSADHIGRVNLFLSPSLKVYHFTLIHVGGARQGTPLIRNATRRFPGST